MLENKLLHDNSYYVESVVNKDTTFLYMFSKIYKVDYLTLLLLYEKLGKDLIYVFYLFSGKKINFPTSVRLQSFFESSKKIMSCLKNSKKEIINDISDLTDLTEEELNIKKELEITLDESRSRYVLPLDVIYNVE